VYPLSRGATRIGRSGHAEVCIDAPGVSRRHVIVHFDGTSCEVEDAASANGTFVDGEAIQRIPLTEGSVLRLGQDVAFRLLRMTQAEVAALTRAQVPGLHDPLTGLFGRAYLRDRLDAELAFAERHRVELSLVVFEVDGFHSLLEAHGFDAGDEVLRSVARLSLDQVRREDVVARARQGQFAILLRGASLKSAQALAERLRRMIAQTELAANVRATISAGCASVACLTEPSADALLDLAGRRLTLAKSAGQNCVVGRPQLSVAGEAEPLLEASQIESARAELEEEQTASAIDTLPESQQLVLALRCQEECSFDEIALVLDMNPRQAQRLYLDALQALGKKLPDVQLHAH
jgi:diguanylate cyclase (GGDEF)-like protein